MIVGIVGFLLGIGVIVWGFAKIAQATSAPFDMSLPPIAEPTWSWTFEKTWGDPDDDEEIQVLRDRLAAALWENRRLKRTMPVDDKVGWLADEMAQQARESEGV